MKLVFIVQGEGRGHMTQAIALHQILMDAGHQVQKVLIGKSSRRKIPDFVLKNLGSKLKTFESPNFFTDQKDKSIKIGATIQKNLLKINHFKKSLHLIDQVIQEENPEVIINFYDVLGGIYNALNKPNAAFWTIGHQYLIYHPHFPFANHSFFHKYLFKINTWLTALGASKMLALSFQEMPSHNNPRLEIIPPLLRESVKNITPLKGDFILTYMVNPGYAEEVISFGQKHPEIQIVAFWDKKGSPECYRPLPNVSFYPIDDQLFLQKMAVCKGLVSTAGFESICEAMYLGKPVMMVPVKGQYEQACNALDGEMAGAGIQHHCFDFKLFTEYLDQGFSLPDYFPAWHAQLQIKIEEIIKENKIINKITNYLPHRAISK
ncbi:glycosyltransferase family protein [Echinicola jeungdonensis]|uniref:Glycosyltransferase family protein n=1 Tax=Echinicola jeungdonensis TaxID=709343 RepID=A0ABV5J9G3_9BACT|nr:glycosyltransferase family protein [Echinicola jeungdonensis]MDN3670174.1 glycosyltransferase family protein [Echinicola jeungdonensis]